MKAIIVEDEPRAIELIRGYLDHFENVDLVATFRNGLKALDYITNNEVDLIFLDINMPHISGIALSRILPVKAQVIFTTAYSEYAVESYELDAVDYLLKPISFERFTAAMIKAFSSKAGTRARSNDEFITVKSGTRKYRVQPDSINYLEKDGNYIKYHYADGLIMARETMREALDKLPDDCIQVHKSYIINLRKISSYDANFVFINGDKIPVSSSFRKKLDEKLRD